MSKSSRKSKGWAAQEYTLLAANSQMGEESRLVILRADKSSSRLRVMGLTGQCHYGTEPAAMVSLERASTAVVEMDVPRENALVQLDARWQALSKDPAAAALSLEAAQLAERQVHSEASSQCLHILTVLLLLRC